MIIIETYLKEVEGKGISLFALQPISKGTIWWVRDESFDKIITNEQYNKYNFLIKRIIQKYGFLEHTGNWYMCVDNSKFTNHSDNPNSKNTINEKGELISSYAFKDIGANEEITCDYREICLDCMNSLGFDNQE